MQREKKTLKTECSTSQKKKKKLFCWCVCVCPFSSDFASIAYVAKVDI